MRHDDYMAVGLQVLADRGHHELKLAEVCRRLGVTSGSFYHFFSSWADYQSRLIAHWKEHGTLSKLKSLDAELDPRRRIERLVAVALELDHRAEGAIRVWSRVDPQVAAVQAEVDRLRRRVVLESACELGVHESRAHRFADAALFLLVGYEQTASFPDLAALEDIFRGLLAIIENDGAAARSGA